MARFFTPSRLSENIRKTPEGYLLCLDVPIARTGWQEYGPGETPLEVGDDGRVWIFREADEVFRPQTVASYNGKSVTVKHPSDFVKPANWKMLTNGIAQNVRKGEETDEDGEEMLLADLLITDEFTIGLVENGLREVSCGYDAEYEQTAEGEGRQFNIIGNHIALVEQGRAGSAYAIKDHKGKAETMTLKELAEKVKNLGKTVDEAVEADAKKADDLKKKKAAKTGDDGEAQAEQVTYDDLMNAVKDLGEKIEGMMGKKKEAASDEEEEKPAKKEDKMEDSDEDEEVGQNSRLDKCEAAIAKILEKLKVGDDDEEEEESEDEESEEDMSGDDDCYDEESEEMEDEEGEEGEESQKKTGDAAKFEILTPGKKYSGKDAREKCLKVFAKTEDGAKVLKQLGMAKPVFDAKTNVNMIFMAASAIVKAKRGVGLNGTKDSRIEAGEGDNGNNASLQLTAEQLNELNAKHYAKAK